MRIVLASGNKGKLKEFSSLLSSLSVSLVPQSDLQIKAVPETGLTFIENALIKARNAARESGLPSLADDSGLCVNALSGAPGIYSARYAYDGASDNENNTKLISTLQNFTDRSAFFVCVLVYIRSESDPFPVIASCHWQGRIIDQAQGTNGFGYDPHFYLDKLGCTSAELTPENKNAISHRGQACIELLAKLKVLLV